MLAGWCGDRTHLIFRPEDVEDEDGDHLEQKCEDWGGVEQGAGVTHGDSSHGCHLECNGLCAQRPLV